jgi:acyl-CoA synthetase (AMP-forming)/AMP-acid ligase II
MTGAKLVFPGPGLDGKSVYELIESEKVTFSAGVPTVWLGLINTRRPASCVQHAQAHGDRRLSLPAGDDRTLRRRVRRRGAARLGHDGDVARWARCHA